MDNWRDRVRNDGRCDAVMQLVVLHLWNLRRHKRNGNRSAESVYIGSARHQFRLILALINEYKPH